MKIYVPEYNNSSCVYLYDKDTIRVLDTNTMNYIDYYINSHYLSKNGHLDVFDETCLSQSNLTSDFYYRNDLFEILGCFIIIALFCFYFPYKIISRGFGRWLKL